MKERSVLISGIGIAGPALAYWLLRAGFQPTLLERAPRPRTEGYIIDFWGAGYDIAERMGLLPDIRHAGYQIREVRIVDQRGRRVGGFNSDVFRKATKGRFTSLSRGDLSAILYRAVEQQVDTLFNDCVVGLEEEAHGVRVRFERSSPRRFDLVIGADGLHSVVRELTFGPERRFERFLGYTVAAFEIPRYRPRDDDIYVAYGAPGRQIARFAMRADRTMFLFIVADDCAPAISPHDATTHKAYLREKFAGLGWECPQILAAMETCDELYFDRVSQIRMNRWATGRIVLVGDAAYAPSLLAGQGSALALIGAYVLAGELSRAASHEDGFAQYERLLHPFMRQKQEGAARFAGFFAPKTWLGLALRNQMTKALGLPLVGRLALGQSLLDRIALPDYFME